MTAEEMHAILSLLNAMNDEYNQEVLAPLTLTITIRDFEGPSFLGYIVMNDNGVYNYHPQED